MRDLAPLASPRLGFAPKTCAAVALGLAMGLASAAPAAAQGKDLPILSDPALAGARVGLIVIDCASGEFIHEHDSDRGFMTASNMKLVSSATALDTLGPDHRFATTLVGTRPIHDGVLEGDLLLIGSGDPSLGGRQIGDDPAALFDGFAKRLIEDHGLRKITGRVLGDDDCQPDEIMGEGWSWGYQSDSYAAQIGGLCFGENVARVAYAPGAPGALPTARLIPDTTFLSVTNAAHTGEPGSRSTIWAQRTRGTNRVTLGGSIPADAQPDTTRVTVENPTAYAAHCLREALVRAGITVEGPALDQDELPERPERYGDEVVLLEHHSDSARELLTRLNKISHNLYAEQYIRAASRHALGKGGMSSAAAHAKATLTELGVDTAGMRIADGSGLTRLNLVQPRQLAALLAGMAKHEHKALWYDTLPIAGVDGTIGRRFRGTAAQGRVRAKTGYISSVVALSGYVFPVADSTAEAPTHVFSVLVNNFTCPTSEVKDAVDTFVSSLCK